VAPLAKSKNPPAIWGKRYMASKPKGQSFLYIVCDPAKIKPADQAEQL
jgi:hypothetical protein